MSAEQVKTVRFSKKEEIDEKMEIDKIKANYQNKQKEKKFQMFGLPNVLKTSKNERGKLRKEQ